MKAEDKYRAQMERLGTWDEAFLPTVHDMCMLEREIRRVRKAWEETAPWGKPDKNGKPRREHPSPLDEHYTLLRQLSKELQGYREALGLTPKGLRRLRAGAIAQEPERPEAARLTVLDEIRKRKAL